jgi:hypothetical protein
VSQLRLPTELAGTDEALERTAGRKSLAPSASGNSPQNPSTAVDSGQGKGDTTGVGQQTAAPKPETPKVTKPGPFHYTPGPEAGPLSGVPLKNGRRTTHPQHGEMVTFDTTKHNGKTIQPMLKLAGKPGLQAALATHEKAHEDHRKTQEEQLHTAVPGLKELTAARGASENHRDAFERAMKDEGGDGVRMPKPPSGSSVAELKKKHPRAALYLAAQDAAEMGHNDAKVSAGRRAMEILRNGGSEDEAKAALSDWLPASAWEN